MRTVPYGPLQWLLEYAFLVYTACRWVVEAIRQSSGCLVPQDWRYEL